MNLPRNDTLIADVEEKLCSSEKVRLDMLESLFLTPHIFFVFHINFNHTPPYYHSYYYCHFLTDKKNTRPLKRLIKSFDIFAKKKSTPKFIDD